MVPLSVQEFNALSVFQQKKYKFLRTPIGVLFWHVMESWWMHMFIPPPINKLFLKSDDPMLTRKPDCMAIFDSLLMATYFVAFCIALGVVSHSVHPETSFRTVIIFGFFIPFIFSFPVQVL